MSEEEERRRRIIIAAADGVQWVANQLLRFSNWLRS